MIPPRGLALSDIVAVGGNVDGDEQDAILQQMMAALREVAGQQGGPGRAGGHRGDREFRNMDNLRHQADHPARASACASKRSIT